MNIKKSIFNENSIFYILVFTLLLSVLFSNPNMKYPLDLYYHLLKISSYYELSESPYNREIWYFIWAKILNFFHIPKNDFVSIFKVIHVTQTYITLFCIYFVSKVVLRNIFRDMNSVESKYFSLWATIIWLTIYATYSAGSHQVWMIWYSVNYQITLALFWYILALSIIVLCEENNLIKVFFYVLQIIVLSIIIIVIHSMEYLYYLMHIAILSLVFYKKIFQTFKKYYYIYGVCIFIGIFIWSLFFSESIELFNHTHIDELMKKIMSEGLHQIRGLNRSSSSVNEMIYLSILFIFCSFAFFKYSKIRNTHISFRLYIYVVIGSFFIFIPLTQFTSGLFSLIVHEYVVNRIYYSSSVFLIIPIFIYIIKNRYSYFNYNLLFILVLVCLYSFSKYNDILNHNYYKNVKSIKNSFNEEKMGFQLSTEQIKLIGEKLKEHEKNNLSGKELVYFVRDDIKFVIKHIYDKNVYSKGWRKKFDYKKMYLKYTKKGRWKKFKKNQFILFETPENFPKYTPYR